MTAAPDDDADFMRPAEIARRVNRTQVWVTINAKNGKIKRKKDVKGLWRYKLSDAQAVVQQNGSGTKVHLSETVKKIIWVLDGYTLREYSAEEAMRKIDAFIRQR
jgi:hypothetical protein